MKPTNKIKLSANLAFMLIGLSLVCSPSFAGKLYKWVDAKGVVSYQDQPPPKGSKILSEKEVKATAADEISPNQNSKLPLITIYTVENCDLCEFFITTMRKNRVPHIERSLQSDREAQSKILEKLGSLKAPSMLIGEQAYQDSSVAQLKATLVKAGFTLDDENKTAVTDNPVEPVGSEENVEPEENEETGQ
jgi:glutaredoxin